MLNRVTFQEVARFLLYLDTKIPWLLSENFRKNIYFSVAKTVIMCYKYIRYVLSVCLLAKGIQGITWYEYPTIADAGVTVLKKDRDGSAFGVVWKRVELYICHFVLEGDRV